MSPAPAASYLSLVAPMYNESAGLRAFFERVVPILEGISRDWEIVCVDDGSRDDTLAQLRALHAQEPRIRVLALSRNFGKEAALTAGLHHTRGAAVIPIDADLQDPPELIPELVAKWREGYKVVLATRRHRDGDSWLKRSSALLFYRMMGRMTEIDIPANTGDFRLMDASVIEVVRLLPERSRFMKGLFAWVGFSTATVYFDRPARAHGSSKQGLLALWALAKDGIFSFTTLPLRLMMYLGLAFSAFAFAYALYLVLHMFIEGKDMPGYTSIMVAMLGMGGIQLVCLGALGEYIGRIYREVKHRPVFVIEEAHGFGPEG